MPSWLGFLYLSVVLDAFSPLTVGLAMATHLKTELVLDAFEVAVRQRRPLGPDEVIHHSDHGSRYTSVAFGEQCDEMNVSPSMGAVGDAYDSAMAESFESGLFEHADDLFFGEAALSRRSILLAALAAARTVNLRLDLLIGLPSRTNR